MSAARQAETAARHAAIEASDWVHSEAEAACRPRGLFLFTPVDPASVTSDQPPSRDWTAVAPLCNQLPDRVVVLIHGLDEPGSLWNELAPALHHAGCTAVRFDYPNDQLIAKSADLLSAALRDLAGRGVHRVDIVAHSMGGLVARDTLTRPAAYGGDARAHAGLPAADRFIMLGTPNAGSSWAYLEPLSEARETVYRWANDAHYDPRQLLAFLADGRGEAASDLIPGSAFLTDLNARRLPAHIAMTVVIGEVRPTGDGFLPCLTTASTVTRVIGEDRGRAIAGSLRAAAANLGDGVVPVASAGLPGVEDTVHLCCSHRGMLIASKVERFVLNESTGQAAPAIPIVLDRLARPHPGPEPVN
jgi:pimeloyl-ACP methyl ester carboxylesterase